jgi:Flp pilus assembly protein TadG
MILLRIMARPFRRGIAAVYSILMLMILCGLVSMGVDLGRVQLAKTQLRSAADGAARAGAAGLATSVTQAKTDAAAVAAANTCDGVAVALDERLEIVYNGAAQNSADAVRITARRIAARNTAIPLVFARLVGVDTCDITAVAIAQSTPGGSPASFVGLAGVDLHNKCYFVSYNPNVAAMPKVGDATVNDNSRVDTNGVLSAAADGHVQGNVRLGPSGSVSGPVAITGTTSTQSSAITAPASPAWSPGSNPGGIPQNYTVSADTTLPGGTYWFTDLNINKNLTFSGPATVYVNGDVTFGGDKMDLLAYNDFPANLKIYQIGSSRTFGGNHNENNIVAQVEAPGGTFLAHDKGRFWGTGIFGAISVHDDQQFFLDETATVVGGDTKVIVLVK